MTIPQLYELFIHNPRITTDSRNCPRGSIFFALKGPYFDGNRYAGNALASGCAYAVIDNPDHHAGERTILVDNVLPALQQLARHHRNVTGIPVIGITGTNGKTTTKELIAAVLSTNYNVLYTEGNLNNQIGVPLTLLRLNREHEMAVVEMGASHPGDIRELVEIAQPDYGIITNVGQAHLEGFGSFENIVKTKGELYDYLRQTKGKIFIRKEDGILQAIAGDIEQIAYGCGDNLFVSGRTAGGAPYFAFEWKQQGKANRVQTRLIGDYNIDNVLASVAVGRYFRIPSGRINRAIASYEPSNNRSQLKQTGRNTLIVDAYNANPVSMRAAISNFGTIPGVPKAVILGDMFELGDAGESLHAGIIDQLCEERFDRVLLCGERFSKVNKGFEAFASAGELIETLKRNPFEGYTILIKGSRGMALERVAEYL